MARSRRRPSFWLVLIGSTAFLSVEPALSLVLLALGLAGVTVASIVMLLRALLVDVLSERRRTLRMARRTDGGGRRP